MSLLIGQQIQASLEDTKNQNNREISITSSVFLRIFQGMMVHRKYFPELEGYETLMVYTQHYTAKITLFAKVADFYKFELEWWNYAN